MSNMKSYFSSLKSSFWKSTTNVRTLKLAPSNIHFTSSSLGDLKDSVVDEKLMIEVSTKLIQSISPPKLQICSHENQWFALNNSHLLIYRQLERIGLCETVVCDLIRTEDIPIGIRQTLTPVRIQSNGYLSANGNAVADDDDEISNHNEVIYCTDTQADSCGYLEGEEQLEDSIVTEGISDQDDESDDDQTVWPTALSPSTFDEIDLDDDSLEEPHKELESLL